MNFRELLVKVAKILSELNIPYAITGGYAVSIWGKPRSTFDIDVVIELFEPKIKALHDAFGKISEMSYIDEGMMIQAFEREGEFNFIDSVSGIKVDFWVAGKDKISQLELKRRIPIKVADQKVHFISPEDLILSKLRWHKKSKSTRQLEDIESILTIQGKKLDLRYIRKWAKIQSTTKTLESLTKGN